MPRDRDDERARHWEDDEDDDYPRRRPRKKAGASTLVKVLVGVGAVLVLGVGGCTLIVGLEFYQNQQEASQARSEANAQRTADTFLEHIKEGRPDAAYAATTVNFRGKMNRIQFADFIADNPILTKHTLHTAGMFQPDGPPQAKRFIAYFELNIFGEANAEQKGKDGTPLKTTEAAVTMTVEDGVWKVDAISLRPMR